MQGAYRANRRYDLLIGIIAIPFLTNVYSYSEEADTRRFEEEASEDNGPSQAKGGLDLRTSALLGIEHVELEVRRNQLFLSCVDVVLFCMLVVVKVRL